MRYIVLCMCLCFMYSCNEADRKEIIKSASSFDLAQASASVKQSNIGLVKAFESQDTAAVLKSFVQKAQLMPSGHEAIEGRDSIANYVEKLFESDITDLKIETKNLWGDSLILTEVGTYKISASKGKKIDEGKYISLWKRESGNWKIFMVMWTTDLPENRLFYPEEKNTTKSKISKLLGTL